ncbi:hypothetical protein TNCV_2201301 [Trichonephila clavipes]|uniref:Uncharacterized protein n=1 Tax=Trichonephila clavipes TaxID=2585209 RepID=A0A8X6SL24_TRICX|nr:hypothetical protein TNCV_2201301 [Trichonephila clavipes]
MGITVNHAEPPQRPTNCDPTATNMNVFVWYTLLYLRVYTRGIPILLRERQVEPGGPKSSHGGQSDRKTKHFLRSGSVCHVPEDAARI